MENWWVILLMEEDPHQIVEGSLITGYAIGAKQIFIYSSMLGIPEVPQPQNGIYRMEVNEKGKVAAVTILKAISPHADTFVMKQLVAWYAKPGPIRIVDVPVSRASFASASV